LPEKLSKYKFKRLATEALRNAIRLHFDSILLFKNKSYPTALQIGIIAIEEIAKADWVGHYYYSSITNIGFPDREFEQEFLLMLYSHPKKQYSFLARELFSFSPKFVEFVKKGRFELLKQKATYVGLERIKGEINVNSRISIPYKIKESEAKKIISLLNYTLVEICDLKLKQDSFFDIEEMDKVLDEKLLLELKKWKFKTTIKHEKWRHQWYKSPQSQTS
jgi:AbiV family abortive infection protein